MKRLRTWPLRASAHSDTPASPSVRASSSGRQSSGFIGAMTDGNPTQSFLPLSLSLGWRSRSLVAVSSESAVRSLHLASHPEPSADVRLRAGDLSAHDSSDLAATGELTERRDAT